MEKKEVYEHLARIYLDASLKYKKKNRYPKVLFVLLAIVSVTFIILPFIVKSSRNVTHFSNNKLSILLNYEPVKINYNFDPVKKEIYDIDLKGINLEKFKTLSFRIKKSSFDDTVHLRIELVNEFNEAGSVYLKDVPHRWNELKFSLLDFKNISNWSKVKKLMFIVEEWNTNKKTGKIYIDDIKFLK